VRALLALPLLLLITACDNPGPTTAQACADFVDAGHCGSVDLSDAFPCANFADSSCDLAPYFQCLAPHYVCVNGQFDANAMKGASACNDLASCR
jgi:hypothetical protein